MDSYAALIGILVGAGIYMATKDAYLVTGPSLVLGYAALAPVILCIAIPYAAFQSTPQLAGPGGDYAHIRAVLGPGVVTFLAAWLKIISYLGALVYLAEAMAGYLIKTFALAGVVELDPANYKRVIATFCMVGFWVIHCVGVRWFGRIQVAMCLVLGLSILVLVVPGAFEIDFANFDPFFSSGSGAFFSSLPILFFAYAGFEALSHTAGEVRDSHENLPKIYLRGVLVTTVIFFVMSSVVVGVLEAAEMKASSAPMADAAEKFLHGSAALIVAIGGVFAAATSVNATLIVPPRLAITVAEDRSLPSVLASVHPRTGTPIIGLTLSLAIAVALLWSGQSGIALSIAVLALMLVYLLHSVAFLMLGTRNRTLADSVTLGLSPAVQKGAAWASVLALGILVYRVISDDSQKIDTPFITWPWTGTELLIAWSVVGAILFGVARALHSRHAESR